jgi:nucleotide-binding universal stress UspA family protein
MYTTIVVGTDGSPQALDAVVRAGELAKLCGRREIHVVTSCHLFTSHEVSHIEAELPPEFHDLVNADLEADNRFASARSALLLSGVGIVEHPVTGDAATGILDVADQVGADLVVVGARGLGAASRFMRGSVSTRVAHHSHCDVLVVEHDHDDDR